LRRGVTTPRGTSTLARISPGPSRETSHGRPATTSPASTVRRGASASRIRRRSPDCRLS
jgi:hypothetical protein